MNRKRLFAPVGAVILSLLCALPFVYIFAKSFWFNRSVSFESYYEVFLSQSQYLTRFWKSVILTLCITTGQILVSLLAGYGFAKCKFPGRDIIFFLLMVLMIMPLQVTLVPNYLMLNNLNLLDTYSALALPMIFIPLGTFIMTQCFKAVPNEIIEAARLDGCGTLDVIVRVVAPMNKSGLVCTALLSFLDGWNMVEQPIVFLKEFEKFPLSVGLASMPPENPTIQLVCCLLTMIPPLFLFAYYKTELVEGIAIGGEK